MVEDRATSELTLSEPLTWREICARYPDEWVALVEVDWIDEDDREFRSARVAGHGKTRKEPLAQAQGAWAKYGELAHLYTGAVRAPLALRFGLG